MSDDRFAIPRARREDGSTSHAAAASMKDVAGHQGREILKVMREAWPEPLAPEQIADRSISLSSHEVSRRLADLVTLGHARKSEFRHKNRSGRLAIKHVLIHASAGLILASSVASARL